MGEVCSQDRVLGLLASLNVWRRGDDRAPHKPLLTLLALGRLSNGAERLATFEDLEISLRKLLEEFGPPRKSVHPEYPFWRLQADQLWEVPENGKLTRRRGNTDPLKSELIKFHVKGGFPEPVYEAFRRNPLLVREAANEILNAHFPASLHSEILDAVGLDMELPSDRVRHPSFRSEVLEAYGHACAFCGYSVRLGNADLGLDAAHIMWHQAGGPDIPSNGLACCSLHHRALDRGAISINANLAVLVSASVHGGTGLEECFTSLMGRKLRGPSLIEANARQEFLAWHRKEVFKAPPRNL
jgi:putative restriction endonuclease